MEECKKLWLVNVLFFGLLEVGNVKGFMGFIGIGRIGIIYLWFLIDYGLFKF